MFFRNLKFVVCIAFGALYTSTVMGQARVGDWELRIESEATATEKRIALSRARPDSGSGLMPRLVIRRKESDSPVELLIDATHDTEKDKCDYKDWKILIDKTDVPVLGYTFKPATTVLKAKWGTSEDELWRLFKKGLLLVVEAEQKCDSMSGDLNLISHRFSLRGSNAAYHFVLGGAD